MQFQKGRAQLSRARCKCAPRCRGAHLSAGGCERYSAMVRTTLEVGRSLTVGSFASFRIASS